MEDSQDPFAGAVSTRLYSNAQSDGRDGQSAFSLRSGNIECLEEADPHVVVMACRWSSLTTGRTAIATTRTGRELLLAGTRAWSAWWETQRHARRCEWHVRGRRSCSSIWRERWHSGGRKTWREACRWRRKARWERRHSASAHHWWWKSWHGWHACL